MKLQDLPHLEIRSIEASSDGATIRGRLSHQRGLREGRAWLYAGLNSVIGDLTLDGSDGTASFAAPFWTADSPAQVGSALPWIDGYWQAALIARILDPTVRWAFTRFEASPARYFRQGTVTGSQPVGDSLPDGATPLHIAPTGWDHEHCEIWGEKIGRGGAANGYSDGQGHWLCESCYSLYAATHSLAFLSAT